jgi:hypothetical protein
MKIVLIFNLPEEAGWAEDAQKGSAYRAALRHFDNELRELAKYQDKITISIARVRAMLREACDDNQVDIWKTL